MKHLYHSILTGVFLALAVMPDLCGQTDPATGVVQTTDGFIVLNGAIYVVHQGQATPLPSSLRLSGTPQGINGFTQLIGALKPGFMLTLDGKSIPAPANLVFARTTTPPVVPDNGTDASGRTVPGLNANGTSINGVNSNGTDANGRTIPGLNANGTSINGVNSDGRDANGRTVQGLNAHGTSNSNPNPTPNNGRDANGRTIPGLNANGTSINGVNGAGNGRDANGRTIPGLNANGTSINGVNGSNNGRDANGRTIPGINANGTSTNGVNSSRPSPVPIIGVPTVPPRK